MKLKDVTPQKFMCHTSSCCPAVLESDNDSYVIIGKKLKEEDKKSLEGRIADDEWVVEVPKGMIDEMLKKSANAK